MLCWHPCSEVVGVFCSVRVVDVMAKARACLAHGDVR